MKKQDNRLRVVGYSQSKYILNLILFARLYILYLCVKSKKMMYNQYSYTQYIPRLCKLPILYTKIEMLCIIIRLYTQFEIIHTIDLIF